MFRSPKPIKDFCWTSTSNPFMKWINSSNSSCLVHSFIFKRNQFRICVHLKGWLRDLGFTLYSLNSSDSMSKCLERRPSVKSILNIIVLRVWSSGLDLFTVFFRYSAFSTLIEGQMNMNNVKNYWNIWKRAAITVEF